MKIQELDKICLEINRKVENDIRAVRMQYLEENTEFNVGDILTDNKGIDHIIKVQEILYSESELLVIYRGIVLKEDLTPKIKQNRLDMDIYSNSQIEKIII
jgi:hypothetical protein